MKEVSTPNDTDFDTSKSNPSVERVETLLKGVSTPVSTLTWALLLKMGFDTKRHRFRHSVRDLGGKSR